MTVADFNKCERIVIVGAGVFGLGTAISIKRKFPAKHVTVIERLGIPAPDASSVDLNKVVRCDYGTDVLHTDLANDAIRRFLEWNAEDEKHGRAPLFHPCGVLVLSKEAMDSPESKYEKASRAAMTANGLASHVVDDIVGANRSRLPVAWNRVVDAGAYKDGYLNMWCGFGLAEKTVVRMADEAKSLGVELKPEHPLTKILYSEDGSTVKGVSCSPPGASSPVEIAADYVVVAAGAWSPSILPELSALLMPTGQSVIHYRLNDPIAREHFTEKGGFTVWFADVYRSGFYGFPEESESGLVKVANHSPGYKIPDAAKGPVTFATGGTIVEGSKEIVKSAGKEFTIPRGELHFMREWVKRNLPELEEKGELVSTRVCWYTDSFDGRFLICPHPKVAGLHIATGGSGHAFKFAPVIGDVILDSLLGVSTRFTEAYRWRTNPEPPAEWDSKWEKLGDFATKEDFTGEIDMELVEKRVKKDQLRRDDMASASGTDIWGLS